MSIRLFFLSVITLFYSLTSFADMNFVNRSDVQSFIHGMVEKYHFKESDLVNVFDAVKIRPQVIQSVNLPMEKAASWYTYQRIFITESRIQEGAEFWKKHADVLQKAEKIYGVPASIIVATIGVETKFGKNTGEFPVIDALANLAFGNVSRSAYFRSELKEFFLLTREQHLDPLKVMGSYAGAIGQPQFMPSSYREYAVSFSGNSKIDLMNNIDDIIGSVANYYKRHGWEKNEPIAAPASIVGRSSMPKERYTIVLPVEVLKYYGLYNPHQAIKNQKANLLTLQGQYGNEYWLSFHNFDVIKRYNASDLYAMAVFQLSQYISVVKGRLDRE